MSVATRAAAHRGDHAAGWLSTSHPTSGAAHGVRHRGSSRLEQDGTAALLRRAVGAAAVWLLVFGLFSMAEGWTSGGVLALLTGVLIAVGIALSLVIGTPSAPGRDPLQARRAGVKSHRIGYGPRI